MQGARDQTRSDTAGRNLTLSRIFVSSTVYDLLDLRAELANHIKELGCEAVMSDRLESSFSVLPDESSIHSCLANIDASDVLVCVLSQRYGPRLGNCGFDDISATHLEFRHAVALGKRVLFYVRDRLAGEYGMWKKNAKSTFRWVRYDRDHGLFDMIQEREKLDVAGGDNWYWSFRDSVELKRRMSRDLCGESRAATVRRLMRDDRLPLMRPVVRFSGDSAGVRKCNVTVANYGRRPALGVVLEAAERTKYCGDILSDPPPTAALTLQVPANSEFPIGIRYQLPEGLTIEDKYESDGFNMDHLKFLGKYALEGENRTPVSFLP